ncbi:hypothetical protein GCM10007857_78550 [Bradyrhizobium iriomotense]|uniref:Uncharacterized protein n=1 Tax=Bradyrhizobium iriomotense TaxID=441950 RepID=A0ABQ6B9R8_9BRAD|nr:hypothetical protein GCM10007857_78550 [Bradyrhizobium iriomotense]
MRLTEDRWEPTGDKVRSLTSPSRLIGDAAATEAGGVPDHEELIDARTNFGTCVAFRHWPEADNLRELPGRLWRYERFTLAERHRKALTMLDL